MARPRQENPTPAELEVLQVVWEEGPCTVREVMNVLNRVRPRAYTSVMSLMDTMARKGQLKQNARGKAFVYSAKVSRKKALSGMVRDLVNRAFDGSASSLVTHLLEQSRPSDEEMEEIHRIILDFSGEKGAD